MCQRLLTLLWILLLLSGPAQVFAADRMVCWFPPSWQEQPAQAEKIAAALSRGAGVIIEARVAANYGEILEAFVEKKAQIVFAGSFVQSILVARNLGTPLLQVVDGREMYACVLILPRGSDPQAILESYPTRITFAAGASSGESCAKAATDGRAAMGVASHELAISALLSGKAKGAMVKDTWWETSRALYPGLVAHALPGISIPLNPDNVLSVSRTMPEAMREKLRQAAEANIEVFGAGATMRPFEAGQLNFSIGLMRKGKINPLTYQW